MKLRCKALGSGMCTQSWFLNCSIEVEGQVEGVGAAVSANQAKYLRWEDSFPSLLCFKSSFLNRRADFSQHPDLRHQ